MRTPSEYWEYLRGRMLKDPLPPEDVAAGWALGVFIGCSIPFGMQLVISVPLALMMRVSKFGATLGTFITNPVTIFVIYPFQTWLANRLFFGGTLAFGKLCEMEWTWPAVQKLGAEAIASFFLGGFLNAIVLTPIAYFLVSRFVRSHRRRRRKTMEEASSRAGNDTAAKDRELGA